MTLFTGSPYEKMMIQKPAGGKRDKSPPASFSPCIGYCIRKIEKDR